MVLIDKNLKRKSKVIPQHAIKLYVGEIQGGNQRGLPVYSRKPPPHLKYKKNANFVDTAISEFYIIYHSAETSH
jgi:hypothetical protein